MPSFDNIETAVRARDIIKKGITRSISTNVPRPIVGRVVSVDLANLSAMVWFTGDEQPIEVRMFASVTPAKWARRGYDESAASTGTEGYGAMVVVQRLNGILYITDILTGGSFAYYQSNVGLNVVTQIPDDGSHELAGEANSTLIDIKFGDDDGELLSGGSFVFGPFMRNDEFFTSVGTIRATVKVAGTSKSYDFALDEDMFRRFDDPDDWFDRWFTVLPDKQNTAGYGAQDWDLDVCVRQTSFGLKDLTQSQELWFRIVNRSIDDEYSMVGTISIHSDVFVRGVGFNNRFSHEIFQYSPERMGFVGFHNAGAGFNDLATNHTISSFSVNSTDALGTADTGEVWGNDASNGDVLDGNALITFTAANQYIQKLITPDWSDTNASDIEMEVTFTVPVVASFNQYGFGFIYRYEDASNYYEAGFLLRANGEVWPYITCWDGGVAENIYLGFDIGPYSAGSVITCKMQAIDDFHGFKYWYSELEVEPEDWRAFGNHPGNYEGTGPLGLFADCPTGNTNTKPFSIPITRFEARRTIGYTPRYQAEGLWHSGPWRPGHLRVAQDLQRHIMFENGGPTWNGSHLSWDRIFITGIGANRYGLRDGYAWINQPANGYEIPILPSSANSDFATADGVPISGNLSLYCAIPPGVGARDLHEYLFYVSNVGTGYQYDLPEWCVFIAGMPYQEISNNIKLGDGRIMAPWGDFSFNSGWSNFAGGYSTGQYRRVGDMIQLKGLIKNSNPSIASGTITTLPTGFRPSTLTIFVCQSADAVHGSSRIDVDTNGNVNLSAHNSGGGAAFISLEGINFYAPA